MLTKKHFEKLAEIVGLVNDDYDREQVEIAIKAMCVYDNLDFDVAKFDKAVAKTLNRPQAVKDEEFMRRSEDVARRAMTYAVPPPRLRPEDFLPPTPQAPIANHAPPITRTITRTRNNFNPGQYDPVYGYYEGCNCGECQNGRQRRDHAQQRQMAAYEAQMNAMRNAPMQLDASVWARDVFYTDTLPVRTGGTVAIPQQEATPVEQQQDNNAGQQPGGIYDPFGPEASEFN